MVAKVAGVTFAKVVAGKVVVVGRTKGENLKYLLVPESTWWYLKYLMVPKSTWWYG